MVRPTIRTLVAAYRLHTHDDEWAREVTKAYAELESRLRGRTRRAVVLAHVGAHIENARRLRARVGPQESLRQSIREALRDSQRTLATAGAWERLTSGQYVVVDRVEIDGRLFLVACRGDGASDPRALSCRERTVARAIGRGCSNKWIGYELGLSESTVGTHLSSVLLKLGLESRSELIQLAQVAP